MFSTRLHNCAPLLFNFYAYLIYKRNILNVCWDFRKRLTLSDYIGKFWVCRKYGISYSVFGIMSFYSFTKFLLLYTEFLMYWKRWI